MDGAPVKRYELEQSQTIAALNYNAELSQLDVELRNGAVYRYFVVPKRLLSELLTAASPGRVFNAQLRGRHGERSLAPRRLR